MNALILSMIGGILSLFSSVIAPETVYLVLVRSQELAVVVVWIKGFFASQFMFRKRFLQGRRKAS
ncbi:hypothetical protein ACEQPO_01170 [Bacillus sp. SL00103]